MEALADMDAVPTWSSVHKRTEVLDKHPDGLPHHVKVTIAVTGIHDTEMLEYHWGPDWMVWDARKTAQQHGQHGEYNLSRLGDEKTRVRFTITVEPLAPLPEFWVDPGAEEDPLFRAGGPAQAGDEPQGFRDGYVTARSAPSRLIASSRVSSRLQKVKRTK